MIFKIIKTFPLSEPKQKYTYNNDNTKIYINKS